MVVVPAERVLLHMVKLTHPPSLETKPTTTLQTKG